MHSKSQWCSLVLRTWSAGEMGRCFFPCGFQASSPQMSATSILNSLFSFMIVPEFVIWDSPFPPNLVEYLICLADFSTGHRWNKASDELLEGFSQSHMFYLWPLLTISVILTRHPLLNSAR